MNPSEKVLLAVSGGMDSMVMLDLFTRSGLEFGVAHCNFRLRGSDSDADEELVRSYCQQRSICFHLATFETRRYAEEQALSIQLAARQLRYDFFSSLLAERNYARIATAHHLNDSLETFLINLARGSGLDGLVGIPLRNGNVIRPLLFATRKEIADYARIQKVPWREDLSNLTDDYARNLLRHKVMPVLKEINPSLEETFRDTVERIAQSKFILDAQIQDVTNAGVIKEGKKWRIDKGVLSKTGTPALILWELLKLFGFRYDQVRRVIDSTHSGKIFFSNTHRLLIDRDHYILSEREENAQHDFLIHSGATEVDGPQGRLTLEEANVPEKISKDASSAWLDYDRLRFPLHWRSWKPGDYFQPLGMSGTKKVSDFLVDEKIDRIQKEAITILESAGEIVWIVGYRISENAKITNNSKRVLKIHWTP